MTSSTEPPPADTVDAGCGGEIMLFGVRVKVDNMRKSASLNNLSEFLHVANADGGNKNDEHLHKKEAASEDGAGAGYASADDAVPLPGHGGRERKRGLPWTEEEHKLFLYGLQTVGKGNWRGISRDYVKTRTPTQVASHAQKYFFRRSSLNRRRRRSSVFDITTDSLAAMSIQQARNQPDNTIQPVPRPMTPPRPNATRFPMVPLPPNVGPVLYPIQVNPAHDNTSAMLVSPVYILTMPTSSTMVDLQQVPVHQPPLSTVLTLQQGQDPYTRQILA